MINKIYIQNKYIKKCKKYIYLDNVKNDDY